MSTFKIGDRIAAYLFCGVREVGHITGIDENNDVEYLTQDGQVGLAPMKSCRRLKPGKPMPSLWVRFKADGTMVDVFVNEAPDTLEYRQVRKRMNKFRGQL